MSFTSYAPDFHDVMLWRALGQITAGRYIDAVAGHAAQTSLGRAFREQGWHGVHAAPDGGGKDGAAPRVVLDTAFDACAPGPVHWLHLDAIDLDEGVLDGWRRSDLRPWIVVVSRARTAPSAWQAELSGKGYALAGRSADTLFYVLHEPSTPGVQLAHLPQPPFRSGALQLALQAAEQRLLQAEQQAAQASGHAAAVEREAAVRAEHIASLQQQLHAVFASTSWRVTKPLRWVARLRRAPRAATRELLAWLARKPTVLARRSVRAALARPAVRRAALRLAARHPALAKRVRARLQGPAQPPAPVATALAASNPASVLGPRFLTLLLDDLAHFSASPTQQGDA